MFGPQGCHEVESVLKALATCGIPCEVLDASEASRRVPQLNLPHGYECVLEEDGGTLSAQGAVKTMQVYNNHFIAQRCNLPLAYSARQFTTCK